MLSMNLDTRESFQISPYVQRKKQAWRPIRAVNKAKYVHIGIVHLSARDWPAEWSQLIAVTWPRAIVRFKIT